MNTTFRKSFARDLKKLEDQKLLDRIRQAIEAVEEATSLENIPNLKQMSDTTNYYRIRVGEHRIGVAVDGDTVDFVRCLPRKDLYKFFPWAGTNPHAVGAGAAGALLYWK